jgi:hypothetical protein
MTMGARMWQLALAPAVAPLALFLVVAPLGGALAGSPPWNPQPTNGDLVIGLPCGSGLVFRKVPTPVEDSPIADRRATLGDENTPTPYAEAPHVAYLVGSFGEGKDAHGWLGKYEVTRGQFVAVIEGCKAHDALSEQELRLPQGDVSWAQAVRFAEAATVAAMHDQPNGLPQDGGARAFIRLPGEAEWEFAARGGGAVPIAVFREPVPPGETPITAYAQLRRVGRRTPPQPVGLLKPDALGLFDMFGNVEEMVADPFRLVRAGRLGGRVGGLVARGGSVQSVGEFIRSSLRIEYPPYRPDGQPMHLATLGFRVALGLPAVRSLKDAGDLRKAWDRDVAAEDQALDPSTDAEKLARNLEAGAPDKARRTALAKLRSAIEAERAERLQADQRAISSAIGAGAVLAREVRNAAAVQQGIKAVVNVAAQAAGAREAKPDDAQRLTEARISLDKWTRSLDTSFAAFSALVLQQTDLPQTLLEQQLAVWQAATPQAEFSVLHRYAALFVHEVALARPGHAVPRDAAMGRLLAR